MDDGRRRKPNRLAGYSYSQDGAYFLTICTKGRQCILSHIHPVGGGALDAPQVMLSPIGAVVDEWIKTGKTVYPHIRVEKYVVMPNHLHILLGLHGGPSRAPAPTMVRANEIIPTYISALKRMTNRTCQDDLWQDGYYDHVVRDENDFLRIWQYIDTNPAKWAEDKYYVP